MPPLSKESVDSEEEIMDLPGPPHPTPSVLDPKPTTPVMDMVGFWFYFLNSGTNYLFRLFLVLWRSTAVCVFIYSISCHTNPVSHRCNYVAGCWHCSHCPTHTHFHPYSNNNSSCQIGTSPVFPRSRHG